MRHERGAVDSEKEDFSIVQTEVTGRNGPIDSVDACTRVVLTGYCMVSKVEKGTRGFSHPIPDSSHGPRLEALAPVCW